MHKLIYKIHFENWIIFCTYMHIFEIFHSVRELVLLSPSTHGILTSTIFSQAARSDLYIRHRYIAIIRLHDLINIMENPHNVFTCETAEMRMKTLCIMFQLEHLSSECFEILDNNKNPNSDADRAINLKSMPIHNPTVEECEEHILQGVHVLHSLSNELQ